MRGLAIGLAAFALSCASAPNCPDSAPVAPANQPRDHSGEAEPQRPEPSAHEHGGPSGHGHEGGPLVRRFEKAEDWAKRFEGPDRDAYQKPEVVVKALGLGEGMVVADIGAGTGYFLPHLSKAVGKSGRVVAIDIESTMVRYMIDRARRENLDNVWPRLGAVDDPLLRPESLDRILIVNTWHHIPKRAVYAKKLAESLSEKGQVFIVDFKLESERGPARDHKVPPEVAAADLEAGGLAARIDRDLLPDQYVVIGEKLGERP